MRSPFAVAVFGAVLMLSIGTRDGRAADAGAFERLSGSVTVSAADKKPRQATAKERIQSGDTVTTDAKSEALIKLVDETTVLIRPNTQFKVDDFKFENKPSDVSLVSVLRGTMRMISGLIGKVDSSRVRVSTVTATVGIRGTDFEVAVVPDDTPEARAGVYDYVHDGETQIKIASGQSLDVKKTQTAFAPDKPKPGEEPLQLLAQPPLFLQQGGGFDALIQSLTTTPINIIHQMPPMFR